MKVLAICGSPRRAGSTETLLDRVLEGASGKGSQTGKIILNELVFAPCQECHDAPTDGRCKVMDDMQKVLSEVASADALVVGSPVFFGSVSAQTKMMIDRFQCLWKAKYMLGTVPVPAEKKKGAFICVSGNDRRDFFENARSVVKNFFMAAGVDYSGELWCPGVETTEDLLEKKECLQKALELGKELV